MVGTTPPRDEAGNSRMSSAIAESGSSYLRKRRRSSTDSSELSPKKRRSISDDESESRKHCPRFESAEKKVHSQSPSGNEQERFTFFFTKKYPFSNHYRCRFKIKRKKFNCTEQYYMYKKAKYFGDKETARKIRKTDDPKEMKALGRKIRGFRASEWDKEEAGRRYMRRANLAKYKQNPDLLARLLETDGTTLVETNPTDNRWGIGLAMDDPLAKDRRTWRGQNWLGEILTKIRIKLKNRSTSKRRRRRRKSKKRRRHSS